MLMYAFSGLSLKKEAAFGVVDTTLGTVLVLLSLYSKHIHTEKNSIRDSLRRRYMFHMPSPPLKFHQPSPQM